MSTTSTATRIALITGAAQGIGEAIALRLANDGLDIALNDIQSKRDQLAQLALTIRQKGRQCIVVCGDVSVEADVSAMVRQTVIDLGGLDVMVANAGIFYYKSFLDTTVEEHDRVLAINSRGTFLCIKYAAKHMIEQGRGGRIICASSDGGKVGIPNAGIYCASKFAIRGLVHSAALEFRENGITVNAYCPGLIATPMTAHPDDEANGGPSMTLKKAAGLPDAVKPGLPSHVADLVSYLTMPETIFVTGQSLSINGGLNVD